ncbi:MAG: CmpA/NrtA family ABC transporter substrate-binding protein [Pseudomonadota bacterium]
MTNLTIGFIPLVDCAVLVSAYEKGFAADEGLTITLERERAWAAMRDKLNLGHLQAAHMLAAMPVAASLGIGQVQVPTIAPFVMSMNGNAITVSNDLFARMQGAADGDLQDPKISGMALKQVIKASSEPLTFAVVYPFSCHNYELRYWLGAAGINPDEDVRLVVIPPSLVAESLSAGQIDGFVAGEPWNSLAVDKGVASIVLTKAQLWRWGPEKVIGMRQDWAEANPETVAALIKALYHAAQWCDNPANHAELAAILAQPHYIGVAEPLIANVLAGTLRLNGAAQPTQIENFIAFHKQAANFPWRSQSLWLYSQMVRWKQIKHSGDAEDIARRCFRPDIYRQAMADITPVPILPGASEKVEGALAHATPAGASGAPLFLGPDTFFDNKPFDPDDVSGYLSSFSVA